VGWWQTPTPDTSQRWRLGMNAIPAVTRFRRKVAALTSVTLAVLALGAAPAGAVLVESGPVWPIPTAAPPAPPPVPALPAAAATPLA